MKFNLYLFFGLLLFAACNTAPKSTTESLSTIVMPFTDSLKADTFKVELIGNTLKEKVIAFTITAYQGNQIYKTSINGTELLASEGLKSLKTEKEKLEYLQEEVKYFFDDEHFVIPAVMPTEKADLHVPDKAFYEELKHSQLNGFNYRNGKNSKIYIAWSVQAQKVMIYYQIT
ncbi:hypothetical protein D9M68_582550 [compost metagenome]